MADGEFIDRRAVVQLVQDAYRSAGMQVPGQNLDEMIELAVRRVRAGDDAKGGSDRPETLAESFAAMAQDKSVDGKYAPPVGAGEQWFRRDTVEEWLAIAATWVLPISAGEVSDWVQNRIEMFPLATANHAWDPNPPAGLYTGRPFPGPEMAPLQVPDAEIVAAALKHASQLDIRERALRLAHDAWESHIPFENETMLQRAERIERWLSRAGTARQPDPMWGRFADWIDGLYGDLPRDKAPGPPREIVRQMRMLADGEEVPGPFAGDGVPLQFGE